MKVLIVTEGSKDIGFGHITRCTALYEAFEDKKISPTFIVNGDDTVWNLVRNKQYDIFNWLKDKKRLFNLIKYADIAVVDSYLADITLYKQISDTVKIPVSIDDTVRLQYPRGIVVNGTMYAEELGYPESHDVMYLLGSRYIPLRKEFWHVPEKVTSKSIQSVMITFGGDDMRSLTPTVLKIINKTFPAYAKNVVIGKGFKNIAQIESSKDKNSKLFYYPDAEGMKELMLESDIAISAGGQTLYELARVGVPTIAIAVSENQMNNIKGWLRAGFISYAGWWADRNLSDTLISSLDILNDSTLLRDKAFKGREHVDGSGAKRVVEFSINNAL